MSAKPDLKPSLGKVLIIEESDRDRNQIRELLESSGFEVLAPQNVEECMQAIEDPKRWNLIISELVFQNSSSGGHKILAAAKKKGIPVVLTCTEVSVNCLKKAINLGVAHFLDKPVNRDEVLQVAESLAKISDPVDQKLKRMTDKYELSAREREVCRWVALGYSNREVAEKLQMSERTVKAHLTSTFKKTGLGSRTGLVSSILREIYS